MKLNLHILYTALCFTALLSGCTGSSNDEPQPKPEPQNVPYITFGVSNGLKVDAWLPSKQSRAVKQPIDPVIPQSIGVFGFNNHASTGVNTQGAGYIFQNVEMYHKYGDLYNEHLQQCPDSDITDWPEDNDWPYENRMPWLFSTRYKFFAYAPYSNTIEARNESYDGFSRIIWRNIPRFSTFDYMIGTKILSYTSKSDTDTGGNPQQKIHMRHMQARVRFCYKLGDKFGDLRYIHVKSMRITDLRGHTLTKTIDYETDILADVYDEVEGTTGYPVTSELWSIEPSASDEPYVVELENEPDPDNDLLKIPYIVLSKEMSNTVGYQPLASAYIFPQDNVSAINIEVTYDVFDLKGVLLRKNDRATNTVPVNLTGSLYAPGDHVLEAGYYYDVNIRVEPSFLYVLSDNDFNSDGYLIITP